MDTLELIMNATTTRPPIDDLEVVPLAVDPSNLVCGGTKHSPSPATDRPWWLWPHLLSLDAPLVALVWQRWWALVMHQSLRPPQEIALFLGVWFIYVADRLADTSSSDQGGLDTDRHAFHSEHRACLLPLATLALTTLSIGTPIWLQSPQFLFGLGLASLTGGYFWLVHRHPQSRWTAYLPKEAVVGMVFSTGTGFFVMCASRSMPTDFLVGLILFAGLCFLNCALITKWECSRRDLWGSVSLLNAFPRFTEHLRFACLSLALAADGAVAVSRSQTCIPVALSALLLALLDWQRASFSTKSIHLLADAALLTPCLWLVLPTRAHLH